MWSCEAKSLVHQFGAGTPTAIYHGFTNIIFLHEKKKRYVKCKASSTTSLSVHLPMRWMISCASAIFFAS